MDLNCCSVYELRVEKLEQSEDDSSSSSSGDSLPDEPATAASRADSLQRQSAELSDSLSQSFENE